MRTNGNCNICNTELTQSGRNKHLISCVSKKYENQKVREEYFLLSIEGKYIPYYW